MKKKVVLVLLALVALLIFGVLGYSISSPIIRQSELTNNIPDTLEAKEIMKTVERAYDIQAEAAYTFDLKKFPAVFINDPRFPLPSSTLQVVREMTDNPSLESAGYLDYKMAYYSWWRDGVLHQEAIKAKAKSENRALTDEEKRSLMDKYGRSAPARAEGTRTTREFPVEFISMEINDDISQVVIDDGPRTVKLILVLVDKQWYIAGIKGISIHP